MNTLPPRKLAKHHNEATVAITTSNQSLINGGDSSDKDSAQTDLNTSPKDLFHKCCDYIIKGIFLFSMLAMPVNMALYLIIYPEQFGPLQFIPFAIALLLGLLAFKLLSKKAIQDKALIWTGITVANLFMIGQLLVFDTIPVSDYAQIWAAAKEMAAGSFNIHQLPHNHYMYIYNWQLGISAIESVFIRIFGETTLPLKIFNLLLINLTLYLTYHLTRKIANHKAAVYAFTLFALFYPTLVTVSQFSNQHLVTPLIIATLLCLSNRKWLIAGVLVAIINMIRPVGIILTIATIVMFVYDAVKNRKNGNLHKYAIGIASFLVSLFAVQAMIDYGFMKLDYADAPISKAKIPYFKFDKGLTGYIYPDLTPFDNDIDKYNAWQKQKVIDAVTKQPITTIVYVAKKMTLYLGCFDWKFEMTYNHLNHYSTSVKSFVAFGWGEYLLILICALIGFSYWCKRRPLSIFHIFYIGITLVYLFIEAFSSYRYESYPILMAFAGIGVERLLNNISSIKPTKKLK
jgi:hypothetical protein